MSRVLRGGCCSAPSVQSAQLVGTGTLCLKQGLVREFRLCRATKKGARRSQPRHQIPSLPSLECSVDVPGMIYRGRITKHETSRKQVGWLGVGVIASPLFDLSWQRHVHWVAWRCSPRKYVSLRYLQTSCDKARRPTPATRD